MTKITSTNNKIFKHIKKLEISKYRGDSKQFLVEGLKIVKEAMEYKQEISYIVLDEMFYKKAPSVFLTHIEREYLDKSIILDTQLFKQIAKTETPQGIIAVLNEKKHDYASILSKKDFFLILDEIQDPGNMGTIIRTAHGAGVDLIIASKGCVDIYNPKVIRSTMGSNMHVPIMKDVNLIEVMHHIKKDGFKIFSSSVSANKNFFKFDFKDKLAIVIGNETSGVSKEIESIADELFKIPMTKNLESLNASVAAGIIMYEVVKQRLQS